MQQATDCHLRPQKKGKKAKKCPICVCNDNLKQYEHALFYMVKRDQDEMSNKGAWKSRSEELHLRGELQNVKKNTIRNK